MLACVDKIFKFLFLGSVLEWLAWEACVKPWSMPATMPATTCYICAYSGILLPAYLEENLCLPAMPPTPLTNFSATSLPPPIPHLHHPSHCLLSASPACLPVLPAMYAITLSVHILDSSACLPPLSFTSACPPLLFPCHYTTTLFSSPACLPWSASSYLPLFLPALTVSPACRWTSRPDARVLVTGQLVRRRERERR